MTWSLKYVGNIRSLEKWNFTRKRAITLDEFECTETIENGVFSIYSHGALIDINVEIKKGNPLIVFFNGAKKRTNELKLPIFSGLKVTPHNLVSRVSINDPSLYMADDISMAWYAGSLHIPLQKEIIPRIIHKLIQLTDTKRLIFAGGSAGGFASLYYSKKFKDSICITSNPQTSIFRYHKSHVNRYLKYCFDIDDLSIFKERPDLRPKITTNLNKYYSNNLENYIFYLQNSQDTHHINRHFNPFMQSLGIEPSITPGLKNYNNRLLVYIGEWGEGHKTAPSTFWCNLIKNIATCESIPDAFDKGKTNCFFMES